MGIVLRDFYLFYFLLLNVVFGGYASNFHFKFSIFNGRQIMKFPYKSSIFYGVQSYMWDPNFFFILNTEVNFEKLCNVGLIKKFPDVAHGTTTLSFMFNNGIVVAVDSRASIGSFIGSKTVQKVLPVSKYILGTMAGGAADCSFWIRRLQAEAILYCLRESKQISVASVANILSQYLNNNKSLALSMGTMITGYDELCGPSVYYIDNSGIRVYDDMFAIGSGSTFALGILDTAERSILTEKEAITLGIKAIRRATLRDAFSGGYISVYIIKSDGWEKVFSEDLAVMR